MRLQIHQESLKTLGEEVKERTKLTEEAEKEFDIALNNARKTVRKTVRLEDFKDEEEYEKEYGKRAQALAGVSKDQSFETAHAAEASIKNLTPVSRVGDKTQVLEDMKNKIESLDKAS
jgi:hypothetical protein